MADKCLLFDPDTVSSTKFLEVLAPRLEHSKSPRSIRMRASNNEQSYSDEEIQPPFELECLEGAFLVASGMRPLPATESGYFSTCVYVLSISGKMHELAVQGAWTPRWSLQLGAWQRF